MLKKVLARILILITGYWAYALGFMAACRVVPYLPSNDALNEFVFSGNMLVDVMFIGPLYIICLLVMFLMTVAVAYTPIWLGELAWDKTKKL